MADLKSIKGFHVQNIDGDPDNPIVGDLYYNTSAGAITVSTKVLDSSSTTTGVWNETSVSANTQERVLQNGEVIVLEANDILKINAGSGSVIDAIISLRQIT